jgi:hypothetical protein
VQALASFIGDCTDDALAEDAVSALAALLPPAEAAAAPVAAALQRLGGLGLVAPLLRRPRLALRVAGLRAVAALLPLVHDAQGAVVRVLSLFYTCLLTSLPSSVW